MRGQALQEKEERAMRRLCLLLLCMWELASITQGSMDADTILSHVKAHLKHSKEQYVADLRALVGFPSVSALPEHLPDILAAAAWLQKRLEAAGMQVGCTASACTLPHRWPPTPRIPTVVLENPGLSLFSCRTCASWRPPAHDQWCTASG